MILPVPNTDQRRRNWVEDLIVVGLTSACLATGSLPTRAGEGSSTASTAPNSPEYNQSTVLGSEPSLRLSDSAMVLKLETFQRENNGKVTDRQASLRELFANDQRNFLLIEVTSNMCPMARQAHSYFRELGVALAPFARKITLYVGPREGEDGAAVFARDTKDTDIFVLDPKMLVAGELPTDRASTFVIVTRDGQILETPRELQQGYVKNGAWGISIEYFSAAAKVLGKHAQASEAQMQEVRGKTPKPKLRFQFGCPLAAN